MGLAELYTPKQQAIFKYAVQNQDWFLMINHGAVRSGKTVLDNDLFLNDVREVRARADAMNVKTPLYILAGFSAETIEDNVLTELSNKYGIDFKFDRYGNFMLFGVKILRCAHGSVRGLGSIRGKTCWGAYINEASLANQKVFAEILFRCSAPGARIIADTNPDHPEHWLKKDYIDKKENTRIVSNHFVIDDNAFLDPTYVESIKASTPSGMMYDRGILGQWVSGDGVVYKDFSQDTMSIDSTTARRISFDRIVVGVDWGWEHYGAMVVVGIKNASYYIIEEISGKYISIEEWSRHALEVYDQYQPLSGNGELPFYCDSARPDNVQALVNLGLDAMFGNKRVIPGIETVSYAMKNNRFFINYDRCSRFQEEIYNYAWDKNSGEPIKKFDDCMDAIRYAIYSDVVAQSKHGVDYRAIIQTMNYLGVAS